MTPKVTVFIPTYNAGLRLIDVLNAVQQQVCDFEFDLLVFDSESTDSMTQRILEDSNVAWRVIKKSSFNHGQTRNLAAEDSSSDVLVFLSQDAIPAHASWLKNLVAPILAGEVVATYAAQQPHVGCHPYQQLNLDQHMAEASGYLCREPLSVSEFELLTPIERVERIRFDNVASAIDRSTLLATPFPITDFGEDLHWARDILTNGQRIAFVKDAIVFHSHLVSREEFFDRVIAVHATLKELCGFEPISSRWMQIRRILGTTVRFTVACLRSKSTSLSTRIVGVLMAPYFATLQMEGMYRGSRSAQYRAPIDKSQAR